MDAAFQAMDGGYKARNMKTLCGTVHTLDWEALPTESAFWSPLSRIGPVGLLRRHDQMAVEGFVTVKYSLTSSEQRCHVPGKEIAAGEKKRAALLDTFFPPPLLPTRKNNGHAAQG